MQQRMNTQMGTRIEVGFELVPKLRRLLLEIPLEILITRRKISFFRSGTLFVSPNSNNNGLIVFLLNDRFESILFQQATALDPCQSPVWKCPAFIERSSVLTNNKIDTPISGQPVPKGNHLRNLVTRIDVNTGNRDVAEKGFSNQPQHHRRVLTNAPKNREPLKLPVSFSQDINTLML